LLVGRLLMLRFVLSRSALSCSFSSSNRSKQKNKKNKNNRDGERSVDGAREKEHARFCSSAFYLCSLQFAARPRAPRREHHNVQENACAHGGLRAECGDSAVRSTRDRNGGPRTAIDQRCFDQARSSRRGIG